MRFIFIAKCAFIYLFFVYRKNLVDSTNSPSGDGSSSTYEGNDNYTCRGSDSGSESRGSTHTTDHSCESSVLVNQYNYPKDTPDSQDNPNRLKPEDYPKDIKLFKADPKDKSKTKELATNEYHVNYYELCDDIYYYKFNDDVNCVKVEHECKDVWKHDASLNDAKYPSTLNYNHKTKVFVLFLEDNILTFKKNCNGEWQGTTKSINLRGLITSGESQTVPELKLYSQDPNDANNAIELNANDYDLTKVFCDPVYTLRENVKCTLIKCEDKEFWTYDGAYPKKVIHNVSLNKICINFGKNDTKCFLKDPTNSPSGDGSSSTYEGNDNYTCRGSDSGSGSRGSTHTTDLSCESCVLVNQYNYPKDTPDSQDNPNRLKPEDYPKDIKLFKADPKDKSRSKELDPMSIMLIITSCFNDDVNCVNVEHEGKEVWKHDASLNDAKYPSTLNYNHKTKVFVLFLEDNILTFKKNCNGEWQGTTKSINLRGLITSGESQTVPELKLYSQDPNDANNAIELNANDYDLTKVFCDPVYTLRENVKCTLIKCEDKEFWTYDGAYPKKVIHNVSLNKICINFGKNDTKCFLKDPTNSPSGDGSSSTYEGNDNYTCRGSDSGSGSRGSTHTTDLSCESCVLVNQYNYPKDTPDSQDNPNRLKPEDYPKDIKLFKADPKDKSRSKELDPMIV
ncbi:conserved hypothetical protein [Theileria orientalis strain Shintoku]|uniref:Uncharacterized protein n=1 Tax=Theileria orientalis strain Shintoku TaxID=869250 RepID=J4C7H1_THEOR|nr:conserved hypothetical protein [Theileria orientalis strain Shintoku]BAM39028.1 conserved hypothetical protein [Theileria orientalis strain Shintoku]|eukprot:XP_009689329.1 conserved hypothetical protein [Theileria orientalis strain Shintoku]